MEQYPDFHVHIESKIDELHKKCYADHLGLLIKLDHAFNDLHAPTGTYIPWEKNCDIHESMFSQITLVFYPVQAKHRGVYSHQRHTTN